MKAIFVGLAAFLIGCVCFAAPPSIQACNPASMAEAPGGYTCRTHSNALWMALNAFYNGKRIFLDMKSGLKVTEPLVEPQNTKLPPACGKGWRYPTGYPTKDIGMYGFPYHDSDFTTLEKDGIREVVPGMNVEFRMLYSASWVPYCDAFDCTYWGYNPASFTTKSHYYPKDLALFFGWHYYFNSQTGKMVPSHSVPCWPPKQHYCADNMVVCIQ